MKKVSLFIVMLLLLGMFSACSSDDSISDSNPILGTWELERVLRAFGGDEDVIPPKNRDIYIFGSNGKVYVTSNNRYSYFLETGEYDYLCETGKQEIMINGKLRNCSISSGKMTISGDINAYSDGVIAFVFTKTK